MVSFSRVFSLWPAGHVASPSASRCKISCCWSPALATSGSWGKKVKVRLGDCRKIAAVKKFGYVACITPSLFNEVPAASQTRQGRYFLVPANQLNYPLGMVCNILSCGPSSPKHIVWGLVISNWQESLWKSCGFWSTVWLIYHLKASWRIWPCSHHSWSGLFWPQALGVRHSQAKPGWVWYVHTKYACSSTCIQTCMQVYSCVCCMLLCMHVCMYVSKYVSKEVCK